MSRYIDADKLTERLDNKLKTDYEMGLYNHGALTESFKRLVEIQPTADVVEVVRCKDCKHCMLTEDGEYNPEDIVCGYFMTDGMQANDYCSYGERREG